MTAPHTSAYRAIVREVTKASISPRSTRNPAITQNFRSIFVERLAQSQPQDSSFYKDMENAATFLHSQRMYKVLLDRYNPLIDLTGDERIEATARRVGLNMPTKAAHIVLPQSCVKPSPLFPFRAHAPSNWDNEAHNAVCATVNLQRRALYFDGRANIIQEPNPNHHNRYATLNTRMNLSQISETTRSFRSALGNAKHIIAVAGAGLSAASGIPTFRGAGGMWRKYDAMSLASPQAFALNPSRVWQFYHYRREKALAAKPNAAHESLALLSIPEIRRQVAPNSTFTLITQNVDGLSIVALHDVESQLKGQQTVPSSTSEQQSRLIEMHGRLFDVVCTSKTCGHREHNRTSPICPALAGTENSVEAGAIEVNIPEAQLPRCSKCGALARPGVVWFGEPLQQPDEIEELVDKADLCLVVGTSSTVRAFRHFKPGCCVLIEWKVHPAALYAGDVHDNGGKVAVFNLERTPGDEEADFLFLGPCEQILPQVLDLKRDV
ncbi:hypothetical protein EVG20_g497 [Dentipellis fragilis]|uniref:NAD-dependent protein deacylase n=1 Tax=Dentipellis fragilis TaxID=205917 RepID=A0A4Y9ZF51_9AGAM|nr:hypothetical protein EVG20_g497 [Dentipellis fragilis]